MRVLRVGMQGDDVHAWELFLRGRDFYSEEADGVFDTELEEATRAFQSRTKLVPDGVVGRMTLATAMKAGFDPTTDSSDAQDGKNWPPRPDDLKPLGDADRARVFSAFQFKPSPSPGNPEGIVILDNWQAQNIKKVPIPQLAGILGAGNASGFFFHKSAATQAMALFHAWEKAGLKSRIRTWGGSWVPRFKRGSRTSLSNHSYGTAFDINVAWNMLGSQPALLGKPGCVRELVPLANKLGWFWGGHFTNPDGMHFELSRVMTDEEVAAVLRAI